MNRHCRRTCTAIACLFILSGPAFAADDDYLSAGLRRQVEQLKADAAREPTTAGNVSERAHVLWQWMNAITARGENLSGDLPWFLSAPMSLPDDGLFPGTLVVIQNAIHELEVKDENPGAVGTFSVDKTGPFPIMSHQTIKQTYTVGKVPLAEGGAIALGHQLMADYGIYQASNPEADDYVTAVCSNPNATLEAGGGILPSFIHGSYGSVIYTVRGTSLQEGDTITVTYGDRSGGSQGYKMQSYENDAFMLPIYVDLEGTQNFFAADWPWMRVVGAGAARVRVFAPSIVEPGETFELALRTEDAYYNRATQGIPNYRVTLNGAAVAGTNASDGGVSVISDLTIPEPGVYRYEVLSDDGAIAAKSNPIWVKKSPGHRIYWGETHGHTSMSEAQGSVPNYFRYGREDARLDFIALSAHDAWMDDTEWAALVEAAQRYNVENEYVVFLAFERTANVPAGGHHNVLFRTPGNRKRVPMQFAGVLSELYFGLRRDNDPNDVLVIPHAHIPGDWRMGDPKMQRLLEIASMHGTFEWFGNYYLKNGQQIGFVGASDNHEGRPGYSGRSSVGAFQNFGGLAAVMVPELTSGALFDAMRNISAYATSDAARIILDASLNASPMGKRQPYSDKRELQCRVMGTAPISSMDVIKNGGVVFTRNFLTAPLESHCFVRINFTSTSESGLRDTPRGDRIWKGTIDVAKATIKSVFAPGMPNTYKDKAFIDPNNPSRIILHTETRGKGNNIILELAKAGRSTQIDIHLDATKEHGNTYPIVYKPSSFEAEDFSLRLSDFRDGALTKAFTTGSYTDHVSFELIDPSAPFDQEISFYDLENPGHGDYYYVRVTQLDGALAWSSPWWVGGSPPR